MTSLCKSKKAQFGNIILFSVIIIIFILSIIVSFIVLKNYAIATTDIITDPIARDIITKGGNAWVLWDYGVLFLTGGLFVGMIISAIFIRSHPVFAWIFILAMILELFMVPMMSNIIYEFKESEVINDTVDVSAEFPIMDFISNKMPLIMAFAIVTFLIVFFGKPFQQVGETGGY